MRRGFSLLMVVAVLILPASQSATAYQPASGIHWSIEALFDGIVKYGEWLPIRVTLSNQGRDRTVEVRAVVISSEGQATVIQPVELARGAHKQTTLYVQPSSFSRRLRFSLVDGSEELLHGTVDVQPIAYQSFLIGIIARDPEALSILRTVSIDHRAREVATIAFAGDEIPSRVAGLGSFDALVLNDVDTSPLTPAQQQSLIDWVRLGGHLIIGGGAGTALTTAGLPDALLPATFNGTGSVDELPGLVTIGGQPVRVPGPFVIARFTPRDGVVLAEQNATPLLVEQEVGKGRVTLVALDLGLAPFGAWAGEQALWTALLQSGRTTFIEGAPDVSPRAWSDEQMLNALTNLPSLDLPSVRWVVLLLFIYILLVGPANYLVLRRARRMEWAWVTIPALTLTFSIGAYGIGYGFRGGEVILNKLSIIDVMPGTDTARVRTYAGMFSPTKRAYSLTVDGEPIVGLLNPRYNPWGGAAGSSNITVIQGQPTGVRDLTVNQWAMQTFVAETVAQGSINIQANLVYRDGRVQGQVTNAGPWPLRDVVFTMAGDFTPLGTLAAGATTNVDLGLNTVSNSFGPSLGYLILQNEFSNPGPGGYRATQLKQQMLDSVFVPPYEMGYVAETGPLIIAWLDNSPTPMQVEGAQVRQLETSLVIARPALELGDREVSIPPGFIPVRLVDQEGGVSQCYDGRGPGFAPYQGKIVLEFRLPRSLHDVDFTGLNLIIESDGGGWQPPATALYDWEAGAWEPLNDITFGNNRIDDAQRFIDDLSHAIRVEMRAGNNQGGCLYTNIALEGTRGSVISNQ